MFYRILSSQAEFGISVVFCVSAKSSTIIFLEAKVSSFSVNHSLNAYLFPHSAFLNGNEPNYSPVSGWGLRKRENEENNISLSTVWCRISMVQSCEYQFGLVRLCDGIIILGNNQSFFSPTIPCSHTYTPIPHPWPIWLHLAIRSVSPKREDCFSRKAKQEIPHGLCYAEMVFRSSGN